MPHFAYDFVDQLAVELGNSRPELERVLDRTEALAALHARALDVAAELNRPVTAKDVFASGHNEKERAQLQLLAERATSKGGNPASADRGDGGGRSESGAGL